MQIAFALIHKGSDLAQLPEIGVLSNYRGSYLAAQAQGTKEAVGMWSMTQAAAGQ